MKELPEWGEGQQGRLGYGGNSRKKPCVLVYPRVLSFKKDWGEGQRNQEGPGEEKWMPGIQGAVPLPSSLKNCHCTIN